MGNIYFDCFVLLEKCLELGEMSNCNLCPFRFTEEREVVLVSEYRELKNRMGKGVEHFKETRSEVSFEFN